MTETQYSQIKLLTLKGPEYRRASTAPPRAPTDEELPVIDLSAIDGTLEERKKIADKIRAAAQNTGFFYISNHGIPDDVIHNALVQAKTFFNQSEEDKMRISDAREGLKGYDGYSGIKKSQINPAETKDNKETFFLRYNPQNDPTLSEPEALNDERYGSQDLLWNETSHLPGFRDLTIDFWQRRLALSRKLIQIFALALNLPEDHYDHMITHPGADGLYIHCPGNPDLEAKKDEPIDNGIGSHTDFQSFTLLWQDDSGGLQVLSADDEWLKVKPIEGTLVVNIGDLLQRMSNNRFKSTVHRVFNRQASSRYSMPFFVGFNPEAVCEVAPTCVDEQHPAMFEPIECGEWYRFRLNLLFGQKQ